MLVVGFVGLYGGPFGDWGLRAGVHLGGGGACLDSAKTWISS